MSSYERRAKGNGLGRMPFAQTNAIRIERLTSAFKPSQRDKLATHRRCCWPGCGYARLAIMR